MCNLFFVFISYASFAMPTRTADTASEREGERVLLLQIAVNLLGIECAKSRFLFYSLLRAKITKPKIYKCQQIVVGVRLFELLYMHEF